MGRDVSANEMLLLQHGRMIKAGRVGIAGGFAAAFALLSIIGASAAPHASQSAQGTVGQAQATSSVVGSAPISLGHFYGKAVSNLAHTVPAGPQHGAVISAFAKSSNPSHTNGHHGKGLALGKAKH